MLLRGIGKDRSLVILLLYSAQSHKFARPRNYLMSLNRSSTLRLLLQEESLRITVPFHSFYAPLDADAALLVTAEGDVGRRLSVSVDLEDLGVSVSEQRTWKLSDCWRE